MTTYEGLDNKLKIAYPKIIVDVLSILAWGVDTSGKKTSVHNVEIYYHTRKSDVIGMAPVTPATSVTTATARGIESIEKEMANERVDKDIAPELMTVLSTIIGRSRKNVQASLEKLDTRDFTRITDLYKNYNKIQKYSKMVIDRTDLQQFKAALEKDIGRKLSSHQIQHATNSVRKVRLYIENVLDGKFVPRGSYGINHTKHTLEYGYLVVGLMERSRKSKERIPKRKGHELIR